MAVQGIIHNQVAPKATMHWVAGKNIDKCGAIRGPMEAMDEVSIIISAGNIHVNAANVTRRRLITGEVGTTVQLPRFALAWKAWIF